MTYATRAGFETREQLGLIRPASVSRNITPERGGSVLHHGGWSVPVSSHAGCRSVWRSWQRYHMGWRYYPNPNSNGHGWVDIAYTCAACQHGYIFAGRGIGVRTAANGTNVGNQNYYAIVWIGGARQTPTLDAFRAVRWAIGDLRSKGAGLRVLGHSDLRSTSCPHPDLVKLARQVDNTPIDTESEEDDVYAVKYGENSDYVKRAQVLMNAASSRSGVTANLTEDGAYGPKTRDAVNRYAGRAGLPQDGGSGMHVLVVDYIRNWLSG